MAEAPDVQPSAPAPAPEPEEEGAVEGVEEPSKVPFGDVLDFGGDLVGWTVVGSDPRSGEVIISKRRGDEIERRTIPRAEYDAALERRRTRPGRRIPKPKFRLNQAMGFTRGNARVIGYDGATGTVQVEATIDGRPVRTWVNRGVVNEAAAGASPLAERAFMQEVNASLKATPLEAEARTAEAPTVEAPTAKAKAPETAAPQEPAAAPAASVAVPAVPLSVQPAPAPAAPEPAAREGIERPRSVREELRERRETTEPTKAYVRSLRQEIRDVDKQIADLRRGAPTDPQITELERYRDLLSTDMDIVQTRLEDAARLQQLTVKREALASRPFAAPAAGGPPAVKTALIEAGQNMGSLQVRRSTLAARPDFRTDPAIQAQYKAVGDQMSQLTALASQAQRSPASAQGELVLRIRGAAPAAAVGIAAAPAAVAGAEAVAQAAAQAVSAAEALTRARTAVQGMNALIVDRQRALDAARGELGQLAQELSVLEGQLEDARRSGAPEQQIQTIRLQAEARQDARRAVQDDQLAIQIELTGLQRDRQALETAIVNVEQGGPSPSPVLVGQLVDMTPPVMPPPGVPAATAAPSPAPATLPSPAGVLPPRAAETAPGVPSLASAQAPVAPPVPTPAAPRRYATGLPAPESVTAAPRRVPAPRAAPGFRQRLVQRLGLPFAFASALTLNVEQQAARRAAEEGVGPDTYELALSQEGGEAPPPPSYTTAIPSAEEAEDVLEGELSERQRAAEQQRRMTATRESLQPSAAAPTAAPPAAAPAAPAQAPARAPAAAAPQPAATRVSGPAQQVQTAAQLSREQLQAGARAAARAPAKAAVPTVSGPKGISWLWESTKLGELLTAESVATLIGLVAEMNAQAFNKYVTKIDIIPKQSKVEDILTVWIDINLLIIGIAPFIIPAAILAVLAMLILGVGGGVAAVAA